MSIEDIPLDELEELIGNRRAFVIKRLFGIEGERVNQSQLAREMELSPNRIHQLKEQAFRKLRRIMISESFRDYHVF